MFSLVILSGTIRRVQWEPGCAGRWPAVHIPDSVIPHLDWRAGSGILRRMHPYNATLYRIVLVLAAVYNLAFGVWAGVWPHAFFRWFEMDPPRYPAIWQCLGMVIGVYGLGYGYAAVWLDRARPLVAIGLVGKVLGPIGWVVTVNSGEWPARTFTIIAFNDLLWWVPFGLLLAEGTALAERIRRFAPYACGVLNGLGAAALLFLLRGGSELVPDLTARTAYISEHVVAWRVGWTVWMAAGVSLVAFYAWWGARLPSTAWGVAGTSVAAAGLVCDWFAESLYIGWWPQDLETLGPIGSLLTGGVANGLYTIGGMILTLGTRSVHGSFAVWTWIMWASGIAVSIAAFTGSVHVLAAATGVLFVLFCPWCIVLGRRLQ